MVKGNKNQKASIIANHKTELTKNAMGETFLKKNNPAEIIENTFTTMIIILISCRLKK
jgi:hypothetical protein